MKPTVYGVATALARSPEQVAAMTEAGWEIASHGLKWVEHKDMDEAEERAAIAEAIRLHTEVVGAPPEGWYTGRCSVNTVRLVAETGRMAYISDTYDDDLPYWARIGDRDQLIIPYTLDANDMRFATPQGFNTGDHFFTYLKDSFDALYAEGLAGAPKMMSVGLHNRLIGRPGRIIGLRRFLDYAAGHEGVWFARRIEIARHWAAAHPPDDRVRPSRDGPARTSWRGSAACSSIRPGSPRAPMRSSLGRRMTARWACTTRSPGCFAARPRSGGWRS